MSEYQKNSVVQAKERLTDSLFRLTLSAPHIAASAQPGQFVMAACGPTLDPLLRRPLSIHQTSKDGNIQLLFKVIGRGTQLLSDLRPGNTLDLIGPLGQGFQAPQETPVCLVGGGIGIAPLFFLAQTLLRGSFAVDSGLVLLGARTGEEIEQLAAEFNELGFLVEAATDDGSFGHHGLVTDLLPSSLPKMKGVYACGPFAMMAAVAGLCRNTKVPCAVSLEASMACGLGACLGCAIHGAGGGYKHVCKHGPVFDAEEIAWNR